MTVYLVLNAVDKFINFRILFSCWAIILMNNPKMLVDRTALKMSRNRAIDSDGYFLHELAIAEVKDRLSNINSCLLYTSPSPRDAHESRMPSSA